MRPRFVDSLALAMAGEISDLMGKAKNRAIWSLCLRHIQLFRDTAPPSFRLTGQDQIQPDEFNNQVIGSLISKLFQYEEYLDDQTVGIPPPRFTRAFLKYSQSFMETSLSLVITNPPCVRILVYCELHYKYQIL